MIETELKKEVLNELENDILPFWITRVTDSHGGFHGRIDGMGKTDAAAPRGAVMNARILWTFSCAYRVLGKKEYLETATRAKREIIDRFIDPEYGGVYWSIDAQGKPLDCKKQSYAQGFAIYGLSEYARATGDKEALDCASKLFEVLEQHAFDPISNGYWEALSRDWQPLEDMRLSAKDQNDSKTMNTHLHIIEPYTCLYRVLPSERLAERIRNLIAVFAEKILRPDAHLGLFFSDDWQSHSEGISFGHDIEASWLLWEAAEVLGDENIKNELRTLCIRIAEAADEGLDVSGGLRYEANPADNDFHWWVEAECIVGNFNAWKLGAGQKFFDRAVACWEFIKRDLICPDGEWYWSRRADGTPNTSDDRAGFWKCPYHNSRMCLELFERVN